jgi:dystonin
LDWFREAHDTILSAEQPAIDTERLKTQLKNQSLMNKDIVEQKANLRNIIAQATKVARELRSTLGGEEVALATKMETARKLADSTAELGQERMAELEQAYALCTELDDSYTDISDWLDTKDEELRSCEPINTGMPPEQLISHKQHNNQMLQAYRDQYPIIAKFERNVTTLAELCSPEDAQNLSEIASGMIDRFKQQEEEFRERGRILDATIEQSSQFTDRLDSFLSNLESATNKLRNPEPVSARPPLLKRQIDDNSEILGLLQQKEGHYQAMKEDARTLLAQTQPGDPTAEEVRSKILALEGLWSEIHDGLNRRSSFLQDTLAKAERFWSELENCQRAVDGLKRNLDTIQLTSADPQMLDENKARLNDVGYGIDATKPAIDSLRMATEKLIANVGEEGKYDVERNIVNLENDWATVTAIYAQMSNNLVDAISRSMDFHELLQQLLAWLIGAEEQIAALPTATLSDPQQIKAELDRISALRADIDKRSILKEQLNRAADELFKNANPLQVNAIRAPITDLNNRWNKLYAAINDRQQRLERALLEMGQFEQAHAQLESWMDKTDITLDEIQPNTKDLKHIEIELCKLKVIQNDIQSHVPSFEAINKAGKALIAAEPHTASITQPKLDTLVDKWHSLTDKSEQLWTKLEISKNDASNRDGELDHWGLWLEDLLSELSHNKPIGGLPETAQSQLDDFCIIKADVEEKRGKFEAELKRILEQIESSTPGNSDNKFMQERYNEMKKNWTRVNEKLVDRQKKLEIALDDAINLNNDMQSMTRWLDNAENYLSNLPQISRLPYALQRQMDSHLAFVDKVSGQREVMSDLNTRGSKIQFTCEKKDAIPIKNRLISLKHRFDKIVYRTTDRTNSYKNAMGESETYFNARNELVNFLDEADKELQKYGGMPSDSATGERIRETLEEHKKIQEELHTRKPQYETTIKRGRTLEDHAPIGEKPQVHEANEELTRKWKNMNQEAIHRQRSLEDALVQSGKFDEAFAEVSKWLNKTLPKLEDEVTADKSQGDLETLKQIYEEHANLMDEIKRRKEGVEALKNRAEKILESPETSEKEKDDIRNDLDKLNDEWQRLEDASQIREGQLSEGLKNAVDLDEMTHELGNSANHKKGCLHRFGTLLPEDEQETLQLLEKLKNFAAEIEEKDRPEVDKALELGKHLLEKCHPAAEESLKKLLRELSGKWDQIEGSTKDKIDKVNKHLDELREHDQKLSDLNSFIEDKEATLEYKDNEKDASTIPQVETLLAANDLFKADLNEKQAEVDEIMKAAKKVAAKTEPSIDISSPDSPTSPLHKKPPLTRGSTKLKLLQQPEKQRKSRRQQKTDAIAEKWRKLWDHTQAYDAKLKQRKEYLAEMKRLENFTFNEWRERYLAFTDHAKARISDLFRRIDTTGTGIVPRQDFINGILNTKFPTTPLEMARVADEFDKGDGKISSKEFMNALRYDPKKRPPPKTESEMIHEELRKETERCTCARRFPITHISTNDNKVQYGFGFGSTMKRMVRILRSTVMVRVGGGWEKLDEFLVKHDPCRAAGRLNLHIHNTPEHAQDQMHEFTPKPRKSELTRDVLTYADGTPGPISKVREKTERSIPMFKKPYPKTSASSRDSPLISYSSRRTSDVNFGDSKIPRPSPSISRSGSRQNLSNNSRPPSRMSDESEERPPSRIPSIRAPKGTPRFTTSGSGAGTSSSSRTSPHPY